MKPEDSQDALTKGLRAVAEDDERLGSSSAVGLRLLAEVQAIAQARRRRALVLSLSAAAVLAIAALVPAWRLWQSAMKQAEQADAGVVTRELVTEFFPLRYSNVPARGGYVVRMQVSRSALASFGVAPIASDTGAQHILADVVVGDDGLARAVRFVRVISDRNPAEAGLHNEEQRP
jgi:hypothetical protein